MKMGSALMDEVNVPPNVLASDPALTAQALFLGAIRVELFLLHPSRTISVTRWKRRLGLDETNAGSTS